MKHIWVTAIIIIVWVATTILLLQGSVDVLLSLIVTMLATFYFIIFGLQRTKD